MITGSSFSCYDKFVYVNPSSSSSISCRKNTSILAFRYHYRCMPHLDSLCNCLYRFQVRSNPTFRNCFSYGDVCRFIRPRGIVNSQSISIWKSIDSNRPNLRAEMIVSEFRSLPEPIDRVKLLLHYASLLPPFAESDRIPSNLVLGCTAQVWLSVTIDALGRMQFSADSDSEITKGFCSCLILILDGASPEEVLGLRLEDLGSLNIGFSGRAKSRINTWHNVLISMQRRTKSLLTLGAMEERFAETP